MNAMESRPRGDHDDGSTYVQGIVEVCAAGKVRERLRSSWWRE